MKNLLILAILSMSLVACGMDEPGSRLTSDDQPILARNHETKQIDPMSTVVIGDTLITMNPTAKARFIEQCPEQVQSEGLESVCEIGGSEYFFSDGTVVNIRSSNPG